MTEFMRNDIGEHPSRDFCEPCVYGDEREGLSVVGIRRTTARPRDDRNAAVVGTAQQLLAFWPLPEQINRLTESSFGHKTSADRLVSDVRRALHLIPLSPPEIPCARWVCGEAPPFRIRPIWRNSREGFAAWNYRDIERTATRVSVGERRFW